MIKLVYRYAKAQELADHMSTYYVQAYANALYRLRLCGDVLLLFAVDDEIGNDA